MHLQFLASARGISILHIAPASAPRRLVGWRKTLFLKGLPALAVAALVRLTVRDPLIEKHPES
jgi:hypothetical protein